MTEDERSKCNAFIQEYIGRKQAQDEWDPNAVGLMRVAYAAGRDSFRAAGLVCPECGTANLTDAAFLASKLMSELEAERAGSAKLIEEIRPVDADFSPIGMKLKHAIAKFEASRD